MFNNKNQCNGYFSEDSDDFTMLLFYISSPGYVQGTPDYKDKEEMYDEIIDLKKVKLVSCTPTQ